MSLKLQMVANECFEIMIILKTLLKASCFTFFRQLNFIFLPLHLILCNKNLNSNLISQIFQQFIDGGGEPKVTAFKKYLDHVSPVSTIVIVSVVD